MTGTYFFQGRINLCNKAIAWFKVKGLSCCQISPGKKAVIVTGCDSGFGHEIALKLDKLVSTCAQGLFFPHFDGITSTASLVTSLVAILVTLT